MARTRETGVLTETTGNPRRWEYGPGELLVEAPDGTTYRLGDVPEEYRDRHKPGPKEIVIQTDEDLERVLGEKVSS
jgi:hypothetical protein